MKTTIIVPTYNEVDNIEKCIFKLEEIISTNKIDASILITDANSKDGTADKVKKLKSDFANLFLIEEGKKQGLGKAYVDAMDFAFVKLGADAVITFDADLSHDANVIPQMVKKLNEGNKMVIGTRYRKGGGIPDNWGIHRKFLSMSANLLTRTLYFQSGISDFTSGFKALSKDIFYKIKDQISQHKGYTFSISESLEAFRAGIKPAEIPYKFVDRTSGESKMGSEYIINGLKFVLSNWVKDMLKLRFVRVLVSGACGAIAQLISYGVFFRPIFETYNIFNIGLEIPLMGISFYPRFFSSQLFSIEIGVLTTFLVNNYWSFNDKKLSGAKLLLGFVKNNIIVIGAIIIQLICGQLLEIIFGVGNIRHYAYQIIGIFVGLIWNFYFYKKIIWKVN